VNAWEIRLSSTECKILPSELRVGKLPILVTLEARSRSFRVFREFGIFRDWF
jgi:hypothetical protein